MPLDLASLASALKQRDQGIWFAKNEQESIGR